MTEGLPQDRQRVCDRTDENLGWTGGRGLGFRIMFSEGDSHVMTFSFPVVPDIGSGTPLGWPDGGE